MPGDGAAMLCRRSVSSPLRFRLWTRPPLLTLVSVPHNDLCTHIGYSVLSLYVSGSGGGAVCGVLLVCCPRPGLGRVYLNNPYICHICTP